MAMTASEVRVDTSSSSVPPELLQDLGNLRAYYEEASILERQIAQLSTRVQNNDRHLHAARRQAAEAKARKVQAADSVPKISRSRREAESRSSEMASALQVERENGKKRSKDNQGLHRSLLRLHTQLGDTTSQTENNEQVMMRETQMEEKARVEEETLRQSIEGMKVVEQRLAKQVEKEREKRLQLKEAARLKLERVEVHQAGLREQLDKPEAEVSEMRERLSKQEDRTREAQHALSQSREVARGAALIVEQQKEARRAMHAELLGVQQAHEEVRTDLETTLAKLDEVSEQEAKAQQSWRLQHIERLDARIQAKRSLDRDIVVAEDVVEDPNSSAKAGGC